MIETGVPPERLFSPLQQFSSHLELPPWQVPKAQGTAQSSDLQSGVSLN